MRSLRCPLLYAALGWLVACEAPAESRTQTVPETTGAVELIPVGVELSEVREILVTHGSIWVLDQSPPFVTKVTPGLEPGYARFGRKGDGPSELRHPVAIAPTVSGIQIWDAQLAKRVSFGLDGSIEEVEHLSGERSGSIRSDMRLVSHLDPWRIRSLAGQAMYTRLPNGMTRPIDYGRGSLVLADADLGAAIPLIAYADILPRDARGRGQFPAMPLWDACPNGFVLWNPRLGRVEWRGVDATLEDALVVPSDGVPITRDGIERFLRQMARLELGPGVAASEIDFAARAREVREVVGSVGTPFVDLRCAEDGRAWLRHFDLEVDPLGAGPEWTALARDGSMTWTLLPSRFEPHVFGSDSIIGVERTESGESLALWREMASNTR